jgi:hypothetical protein
MADSSKPTWGLCISCKWWQIEPDAKAQASTAGYCIDEKLQPFQLRVTGDSGCNRYMEGMPARGKGSSAKPPAAKPAR